MSVAFTVDIEPIGKARPRLGRFGNVFTPAVTVAYERALGMAARCAMGGKPLLAGPVHLEITAHMSIPASWSKSKRRMAEIGTLQPTGKPDLDNIMKAAADAFNGVIWRDDAQIVHAVMIKRYGTKPSLHIMARVAGNVEAFDALDQIAAQRGRGPFG